MPLGAANSSAALLFEKVNNGFLSVEWHSEPSRTFEMQLPTEIFNSLKPWAIFAKGSMLYIWGGSEYASDLKRSDKEMQYLTIDILLCCKSHL